MRWRDYIAWGYLLTIVAFIVAVQITPKIILIDRRLQEGTVQAPKLTSKGASPLSPASIESEANREPQRMIADSGTAFMKNDPESNSFIPFDLSLTKTDNVEAALAYATDGSITVRKGVKAGSRELGAVDITIDRDSRLLMDIGDVRQLLGRDQQAIRKLLPLPASGLTSFAAMRERGVDFRYDPNRDMITLDVR